MANKLYRERREFIQWLAMPAFERSINSQKGLAAKMGVDEATLSHWRHEPGVMAEVNKIVDEHFGDEYAEIAESFKREARKGSFPHQKLYFEMLGKYTPKQENNVQGELTIKVEYEDADSDTNANAE